ARETTPGPFKTRSRRTKVSSCGAMPFSKLELPHPLILLLAGVAAAAALTWILPAGAFDRRDDPATGRRVGVAGTYHAVQRAPVGPFAAAVARPPGFLAAAHVGSLVPLVGGARGGVGSVRTPPPLPPA